MVETEKHNNLCDGIGHSAVDSDACLFQLFDAARSYGVQAQDSFHSIVAVRELDQVRKTERLDNGGRVDPVPDQVFVRATIDESTFGERAFLPQRSID